MSLPKGSKIEGYIVEDFVAEAGMVTVYKVRHPNLDTIHALKILQGKYADVPEIRKGFLAEMRLFSSIQHPNLVSVAEVLKSRKHIGIVMDWLDGESLQVHLRRMGKVDQETALTWTVEVLTALQQLHQHRMYHLEISPANIFLAYGPQGTRYAVLMDYGVGHRFLPGNVQPAFSPHARFYISPELITNPRSAGARSDIYSVGVCLYEMLSGSCPFLGDTVFAISNAIVSGTWKPVHETARFVPKSISHAISQSMQKNPVARYPTAKAFIDSLSRAVGRSLAPDAQEKRLLNDLDVMFQDIIDEVASDESEDEYSDDYSQESMDEYSDEERFSNEEIEVDEDGNVEAVRIAAGEGSSIGKPSSDAAPARMRAIDKRKGAVQKKGTKAKKGFKQQFGWLHFILLLLLFFWIYWSFFRGRNVFIVPKKMPTWGEKFMKVDGKVTSARAFPLMSLGSHMVEIYGGLYDGEDCLRCCWKKEIPFNVPIGAGEFIFAIYPKNKDGKYPTCPTASMNMSFSFVPPGKFFMGSGIREPQRGRDELRHQVEITRPILVSQTEITQGLYSMVMGENPSQMKSGENYPVETVSWLDATHFSNKLSELEGLEPCYIIDGETVTWEKGLECRGYRLLTEAEWEYSARADKSKPYAGSEKVEEVAWIATNSQGRTESVGQKRANSWLLYDMSGNVHEWVWDIYGPYNPQIYKDPKGPLSGVYHVLRGGDWYHIARRARISNRDNAAARFRAPYIGFRVARSAH